MLLIGGALSSVMRSVRATSGGSPLEVPIEFQGGLIWLAVEVPASREPLQFLLDSGASDHVLDLGTARRLDLPTGGRVPVQGVGAEVSGRWPVRVGARLAGLDLGSEFLGLDLKALSKACGRRVDGLVGADFFREREVEIDYRHGCLRLRSSRSSVARGEGVPLAASESGFCVELRVNGGVGQRVRLDTGCATALQWVCSDGVFKDRRGGEAVGLSKVTVPQTLTGVRIGDQVVDTVPTGLHGKPWFPGESGLVGNGLLAMFGSVTIDVAQGRLFLGPVPGR